MINKKTARSYCKDDISKIENYEEAINDTELWVCHHRLELTINVKNWRLNHYERNAQSEEP